MAIPAWQCPPRESDPADVLAWCKRTRSQALSWLMSQSSYREFNDAIKVLEFEAQDDVVQPDTMSDVSSGEVRRNTKELVATLSNMKASASFKTDNADVYNVAGILNKLYMAWWHMARPALRHRDQLQLAAAAGAGFICPEWDPDFHGFGRGNVRLSARPPQQVLPIQLPQDGDYQNAYAVHLITEMPIAEAHMKFPAKAGLIKSDRDSPSWLRKGFQRVQEFLSPVLEMFGATRSDKAGDPIFPTVDIHYCYVKDNSVNITGKTIVMGDPATNWSYAVPSVGQDIDSGVRGQDGSILYRKATMEDARLYPNRRLIKWCNSCLIDDDVSPFWHGQLPAIPVSLDKWAWDPIGKPVTYGSASLERSVTRLMRAIDDSAVTRLDPPLVVTEQLSEDYAEGFSCRIPGQMLKMNTLSGEPVKPLLPSDFYNLPAWIAEYIKFLETKTQRNMGVLDVQALAKAAQLPSQETLDKMKDLSGPLISDMTDQLEACISKVGEQWMWLTFQFLTVKRRLQLLGDDGVTSQDFDFDPGSLVPSHLPGENPNAGSSRLDKTQRAKWFAGQFYFFVIPGSLHNMTNITQKLMMIQLKKAGVPIDRWTMAEIFDVPNYGPPPAGTTNVQERLVAEQRMAEEAMKRQAVAMGVLNEDGTPGPASPQGQGAGNPVGRPPSGLQPPQIVMKDDGQRSTISQSGS